MNRAVPTPRVRISMSQLGTLTVVIPSRARVPAVILCCVVLAVLTGTAVTLLANNFDDIPIGMPLQGYALLLVPAFIFATFIFTFGYALGWQITGYEKLVVEEYTRYEFRVFGLPIRRNEFLSSEMSNARLATQSNNDQWRIHLWSSPPSIAKSQAIGMLTFDYGSEPFSFGTSLSPLEAKMVLETMNDRLKAIRS